jgi:hypothetical protein
MVGARQFNLMETTVNKLSNTTKPYRDTDCALIGNTDASAPVLEEARMVLAQANALANRLLAFRERLFGGYPVEAEGINAVQAPANGDIDRFRRQMADTRMSLVYADAALDRIEQELVG